MKRGFRPYTNDASARVASGLPTSVGKHLAAGLCRSSRALAAGSGGDNFCTLKVDTQAEDTIVNDPSSFLDGVHTSVRLELLTITPGGKPQYTAGQGTATFVCADGTHLNISNAHLYVGGTTNVLAMRKIERLATLDLDAKGLRMVIDGELLSFDGGYCAFKVKPLTVEPITYSVPPESMKNLNEILGRLKRHPEALSAILTTVVHPRHFGGVTGNECSAAGLQEMSEDELGERFQDPTALGARQIKELPAHTNAPALLGNLPKYPSNDEYSLKANMRKVSRVASG